MNNLRQEEDRSEKGPGHGLHDGNEVGAVQVRLLLAPSLHGQGLLSHDGPQEREAGANRCSQELLCVTDLPHRVPPNICSRCYHMIQREQRAKEGRDDAGKHPHRRLLVLQALETFPSPHKQKDPGGSDRLELLEDVDEGQRAQHHGNVSKDKPDSMIDCERNQELDLPPAQSWYPPHSRRPYETADGSPDETLSQGMQQWSAEGRDRQLVPDVMGDSR
mmetsp:Transcript_41893/g.132091  ORF Transcript_41893/g.132091 Transcript_41893/m.132091 type:complete len:219 (+) Transcript_41893:1985-2641(+)